MKVRTISITNFKAISELFADFNGCSAIITGGNNKGKTSFITGLVNRLRGERPDLIVKQGEKEGKNTLELTTGEKFVWEFNAEGKDKLAFYTKDGIKANVTKEIVNRFFPPLFDIDEFLSRQPKEQLKMLQNLVGIDFTKLEVAYQAAYNERTYANKRLKELESQQPVSAPEPVKPVNVAELIAAKEQAQAKMDAQHKESIAHNNILRSEYEQLKEQIYADCLDFNNIQADIALDIENAKTALSMLVDAGYIGNEVSEFIANIPPPQPFRAGENELPPAPDYVPEIWNDDEVKAIDQQINNAVQINASAAIYESYVSRLAAIDTARQEAANCDAAVKAIEAQKQAMVQNAKLPQGFSITDDGIFVDGFALNKQQLSTSKFYCAALRLAAMNLGEVRTLHFDASALDKNTLSEIQEWANSNDLQLLIERPAFDGGDIKYELIETL